MAEGSHATFSGYPKTCTSCGQPVRITGLEPLWFETIPRQSKRSYHVRCYLTSAPAPTLPGPAPKGDCALAGATAQPDGQTAVAPLYSPTSARSPRNGGDMQETPEPQPEPEPDDGNGDEDE